GWVSAGPENYVVDVFELIIATGEDESLDLSDARNWPPMGEKTLSGYQRNHLFHNRGGALFQDVAARHGVDSIRDARGVAVADFDGDGRLDLFVTHAGAPPSFYRNVQPTGNHWLELSLAGAGRNPAAIGARVWATAGGETRVRFVDGGNGFAGQSTRRVHFGLGRAGDVERLDIAWPSGRRKAFEGLPADRIYRAFEGRTDRAEVSSDSGARKRVRTSGSKDHSQTSGYPAHPAQRRAQASGSKRTASSSIPSTNRRLVTRRGSPRTTDATWATRKRASSWRFSTCPARMRRASSTDTPTS
ncbi:MAG TPA: CRTAC1 family protein, partial [Thermoanaerobaculia bacterium]|nr:CRTAC1 family protein [Thermoanaerobaculia bacterium]